MQIQCVYMGMLCLKKIVELTILFLVIFYRAGGQKINKTSNKVILLHIPTQLRVECQVRNN